MQLAKPDPMPSAQLAKPDPMPSAISCTAGATQHYAHGFSDGNEVLRSDKAISWSENVEIAEAWRGPTRQLTPVPAMKERTCSRLLNCCVFRFTIILQG